MKFEELATYLKKGSPATVYVLTGTERLLKDECVEAIHAHFEKTTKTIYTIQTFHPQHNKSESNRLEPAAVLDTLRSASLFGGRQLAVVHDADPFYAQYKDVFTRYVAHPSKQNILVLELANFRPTKAITEAGTVTAVACNAPFDSPPPWQANAPDYDTPLATWTVTRAKSAHGKKLAQPAAHALNLMTGRDLGKIEGELTKLALYVDTRSQIREEDIAALAGHDIRGSIYHATERFFARDLAGTLKAVRLLYERGFVDRGGAPVADPVAITLIALGTWRTELRKLWNLRRALSARSPKAEIMKLLKFQQDFQYENAISRAKKWTDTDLAALLDALVHLDAALKTTGANPAAAFEQFVLSQLTQDVQSY